MYYFLNISDLLLYHFIINILSLDDFGNFFNRLICVDVEMFILEPLARSLYFPAQWNECRLH